MCRRRVCNIRCFQSVGAIVMDRQSTDGIECVAPILHSLDRLLGDGNADRVRFKRGHCQYSPSNIIRNGMRIIDSCTLIDASATIDCSIFEKAKTIRVNPLMLMLPTTVTCSYAFMFPAATAPNAIVFSAAKMNTIHMVRAVQFTYLLVCIILIFGVFCVCKIGQGWVNDEFYMRYCHLRSHWDSWQLDVQYLRDSRLGYTKSGDR